MLTTLIFSCVSRFIILELGYSFNDGNMCYFICPCKQTGRKCDKGIANNVYRDKKKSLQKLSIFMFYSLFVNDWVVEISAFSQAHILSMLSAHLFCNNITEMIRNWVSINNCEGIASFRVMYLLSYIQTIWKKICDVVTLWTWENWAKKSELTT